MIIGPPREQDHSVTLTTPDAVFGERSRNELDSLGTDSPGHEIFNGAVEMPFPGVTGYAYDPGQILIMPTIKTITSHLDHLESRFTEIERELDALVALHDRLIALQERIICDRFLDRED